jgi:hypothetical protein
MSAREIAQLLKFQKRDGRVNSGVVALQSPCMLFGGYNLE